MGNRQLAILGAILLILGFLGVWRLVFAPRETASPPKPPVDLYARALLRIETVAAEPSDGDVEPSWLENELRFLLVRSQVALARPQGPYDAGDGAALFTLRVVLHGIPDLGLQLALLNPAGEVERSLSIEPATTRLALMQATASRLPTLLPRGDTGIKPVAFLGTQNPVAYEALARIQMESRGTGAIPQSGITTRDSPIDQLVALTRQQPDFARAWSELALMYLRIDGEDVSSLTVIAEQAAQRAIEIDPGLAEAHTALGLARQRQGQWLPADTDFSQALALDPASGVALEAFTCLLADAGRTRYATLIGEQAVNAAPQSERARECLTYAQMAQGAVLDTADTTMAGRPRALAQLLTGRLEEARALLAADTSRSTGSPELLTAITNALQEPRLQPQALRTITQAASEGRLDAITEILYGVALKQSDFVFNRLLRLRAQREEIPARFLWIRETAFLREHPRFARVVAALGLTAYWTQRRKRPDICDESAALAICQVETALPAR